MLREGERKRLREARVKITITHCTPGYPLKLFHSDGLPNLQITGKKFRSGIEKTN